MDLELCFVHRCKREVVSIFYGDLNDKPVPACSLHRADGLSFSFSLELDALHADA